jgi:5-formyltetrahydrofolate cyclo-ligase
MKANTPEETKIKSQCTQNTIMTHPALALFHSAKSIGIFFSLPHEFQTNDMINHMLSAKKHVFLPRVINSSTGHMEMYEIISPYDFLNGLDRSEWNIMEPSFKIPSGVIVESHKEICEKNMVSILTHPDFKCHFDGVTDPKISPNQNIVVDGDVDGDSAVVGEPLLLEQQQQQQQQQPLQSSSVTTPHFDINRPSLLDTIECLRDIELLLCPFITCDIARTRVGYGGGFYDRFIQRLQKARFEAGLPRVPVWGLGLPEQMAPDDVILPFDTFDVKMDLVVVGERVVGLD